MDPKGYEENIISTSRNFKIKYLNKQSNWSSMQKRITREARETLVRIMSGLALSFLL